MKSANGAAKVGGGTGPTVQHRIAEALKTAQKERVSENEGGKLDVPAAIEPARWLGHAGSPAQPDAGGAEGVRPLCDDGEFAAGDADGGECQGEKEAGNPEVPG